MRRCQSTASERISSAKYLMSDQQGKHGNAEQVRRHLLPGVVDLLRQRLVPDVTEAEEIGARWIGHAALQISHEFGLGYRHRSIELRREKQRTDTEHRGGADYQAWPVHAVDKIVPDDHDGGDGRH